MLFSISQFDWEAAKSLQRTVFLSVRTTNLGYFFTKNKTICGFLTYLCSLAEEITAVKIGKRFPYLVN